MSKIRQEPQSVQTRLECRGVGGGRAAGAMMANLPFSISAVFNKGFSLHPLSLPPSPLLAWGAARGPPDAYRQMSLVEQNTLCLTSRAATGLWRKLKGWLPCKDHSIKARLWVFLIRLVSNPPTRIAPAQQDTAGSLSVYRHNICHFFLGGGWMLLFPQRASVRVKRGLVAPAGIKSSPLVAKRCNTLMI